MALSHRNCERAPRNPVAALRRSLPRVPFSGPETLRTESIRHFSRAYIQRAFPLPRKQAQQSLRNRQRLAIGSGPNTFQFAANTKADRWAQSRPRELRPPRTASASPQCDPSPPGQSSDCQTIGATGLQRMPPCARCQQNSGSMDRQALRYNPNSRSDHFRKQNRKL